MAVIKAKPDKVVAFFLGLLERELVTPFATTRVADDFFNGAKNDTVTLRVGGLRAVARDYEWRTRTAPIVMDDITGAEDGIAVKLDTHIYSATGLTDEQMTLDEINFATEVLRPQVEAVTGRIETKVTDAFANAPFADTITFGDANADPYLVALEANRVLDTHKVAPRSGRVMLVGSNIAANFLASDRIARYDSAGDLNRQALKEATIGSLANTPIIVADALDPDEGYLLHRSAMVLGNVAPVVPQGATAGRTMRQNGFAARWIQDYDPNYLRDRSVVSSFMGVTSVNDERDENGDILPPDFDNVGTFVGPRNVRGLKLAFTGTATVLD